MRGMALVMVVGLVVGCGGIERGKTYPPPDTGVGSDPGGEPDGRDGAAPGEVEEEVPVPRDADGWTDAGTEEVPRDGIGPEETQVGPGVLRHVGWFGPGGVVRGSGVSGLGSLSGPQQAWPVK